MLSYAVKTVVRVKIIFISITITKHLISACVENPFSLAGACFNKLIICEPEKCKTLISEPATTLVNDYEEMLKSFQKLSLNPTIKEKIS